MHRIARTIALIGLLSAAPALAQQQRISGEFTRVSGETISIRPAGGTEIEIALPATTGFARLIRATASDLRPGLFVGVGARPQADGSQKAVQIVIFPEAMRGVGEGHRAWGVMPEATMTNGAIAETVQSVSGSDFTLTYKDGAQKVTTPPDASILALQPATRTDLKAGARGQIIATPGSDGKLTATRVTIWGEGVTPY